MKNNSFDDFDLDTVLGKKEIDLDALLDVETETDESLGEDEYPDPVTVGELLSRKLKLPPEIIFGVLRRGSKMAITGRSKAGKSFLALELAVCFVAGRKWLGHKCSKGRALYINFELQAAEVSDRIGKVMDALNLTPDEKRAVERDFHVWNLKGYSYPLEVFVEGFTDEIRKRGIDLVIIDPIYKLLDGSENEQDTITKFCNALDKITEAGAAAVYVHHHRKGDLSNADSQDRSSGSGVFARDADAILDLLEVFNPGRTPIDPEKEYVTAWRLSYVLRSFRSPEDIILLWDYPIHRLDVEGLAKNAKPGSRQKNAGIKSGETRGNAKDERIARAKALKEEHPEYSVKDIGDELGVTERTVRDYLKE